LFGSVCLCRDDEQRNAERWIHCCAAVVSVVACLLAVGTNDSLSS
jgi:hypothetical protein